MLFVIDACGLLQILMDHIDGSSLADFIKPPGLQIDIVKEYAKQLVSVLNYLHGKSIVHRDLQVCSILRS